MSRILLLEDDTMIASGILYALETEGYETNHATGIKDARSLIEHYNFDHDRQYQRRRKSRRRFLGQSRNLALYGTDRIYLL